MAPSPGQPRITAAADEPNAQTSDQSLLRRFRRGSENAATQLYLRYAGRLRALARAKCANELASRVDADDIVQSVFRSFFQAAGRGVYEIPGSEDLWKILVVIALNKIRTQRAFHRAAKRDVRLTAGGNYLENQPYEDTDQGFLHMVIDEALERLPPPHRVMVELRIQGHEIAHIAEQTGRSKRTVERLLQEARTQLHALFAEAV
jgi:RNA polymerase sigma-70 factor (ECF subfamily)